MRERDMVDKQASPLLEHNKAHLPFCYTLYVQIKGIE
jgi:hypothetical protein